MTPLEYLCLLRDARDLRVAGVERVEDGVHLVASAIVHASEQRPVDAVQCALAGLVNIGVGIGCERVGSWVQQALERTADRGGPVTAGVHKTRSVVSVGPGVGPHDPTGDEPGSSDPSSSRFLGRSGTWRATSSHTPTVFLWTPPPSERYRGPWVGSAVRSGGVASPGKRGCR